MKNSNWYIVKTTDADVDAGYLEFSRRCISPSDVRKAIKRAKVKGIPCWRLNVSEYAYDKDAEDEEILVDSINAEEWILENR